ncbi:HIT family protein [Cycloclasticus pugetii]|uniref:HIT family protein n=1 Tax=Cycloclasticus pugetii TaxID=34068 RepID=UPI0009331D37|nr:HIT domain-containing protein [Cycloclasticus pugetii]
MNEIYEGRQSGCFFCELPDERILCKNKTDELSHIQHELVHRWLSRYTLTRFVFPKRHVASYFDLTKPEVNACNLVLKELKDAIRKNDSDVTGFNIGINVGEDAGQTIFHCHIHLIPKRKGDMVDPRGSVRGLIPEKQKY